MPTMFDCDDIVIDITFLRARTSCQFRHSHRLSINILVPALENVGVSYRFVVEHCNLAPPDHYQLKASVLDRCHDC